MVVGRNDNIDATHGHRTKNLILDLKESSSQCDYQFSIISMLEIMSLQVYWKNEHWKVTPSIKSWHVKNCLLPQDVTFDLSLLRQPLLTPSLTYFYNPSLSWRYVVFVHRTGMTWPRDAPCKTNTSNRENAQRLQQQSSVRKVRQFLLSRKKMRIAVSASQKDFFRVNEETPH